MDVNLLRETVLLLALIAFCAIVWWAYAPSRRARFERDALSVLEDDPCTPGEPAVVKAQHRGA